MNINSWSLDSKRRSLVPEQIAPQPVPQTRPYYQTLVLSFPLKQASLLALDFICSGSPKCHGKLSLALPSLKDGLKTWQVLVWGKISCLIFRQIQSSDQSSTTLWSLWSKIWTREKTWHFWLTGLLDSRKGWSIFLLRKDLLIVMFFGFLYDVWLTLLWCFLTLFMCVFCGFKW